MFTKKPVEEPLLKNAMNTILLNMEAYQPDSDEYAKMVEQFVKLSEVMPPEKDNQASADVKLTVAANLVGILMMLGYEHGHVITSKVANFVMKLK